jgi:multidrug efflux pump subunit AcrA (membrane-fusion protein)
MSAKVQFEERAAEAPAASAAPVVAVPADAVARRDGKPTVFEVVDGRARARAFVPGGERQGMVVVRNGLLGTETLVARPPETLKDGDAVRVKE